MVNEEINADLYIVNAVNKLHVQAVELALGATGVTDWRFVIHTEPVRDSYQWYGELDFTIAGTHSEEITNKLIGDICALRVGSLRFFEANRAPQTVRMTSTGRVVGASFSVKLGITSE